MKIIDDAAQDFVKAHPNIEIKVDSLPFDELWQKIYAAIPAGTGPDMLKQKVGDYFKMRDQNILVEYDDMIFPDSWLKEHYPTFDWAGYGRYIIPTGGMGAMMIYNKKMFQDAGLDPEKPPATWDDFFTAAQKLTKTDSSGAITQAGFVPGSEYQALDYLYQVGGHLVKKQGDKLESTFNTPEMAKAYSFLADSVQKYKVWSPDFLAADQGIGNAKAGMYIGEGYIVGNLQTSFPDVFPDLAYAPPPTPTGEPQPYYGRKSEVLLLSVMKGRPDNEYAPTFQFLEYFYKQRTDSLFELVKLLNLVPDRKELFDEPDVKSSASLTTLINVLPKEFDPIETTQDLQKILDDVRDRIILQNEPIASALVYGDQQWQKVLDDGLVKHIL